MPTTSGEAQHPATPNSPENATFPGVRRPEQLGFGFAHGQHPSMCSPQSELGHEVRSLGEKAFKMTVGPHLNLRRI